MIILYMSIKVWYFYLLVGVALDELGRFEEGISMYDIALEIHPNDPPTMCTKGFDLNYSYRKYSFKNG